MKIAKKNIIFFASILVLIVAGIIVVKWIIPEDLGEIFTVKRGNFEETIYCKGEINSASVVEINLPKILQSENREVYFGQFKIMNMVEEGKSVKKGDFIAQLDPSQIMSQMRNYTMDLERMTAEVNNMKIDTTVRFTQLKEDINDALLDLEYNKIDLEQSVYESEAYQRKVKMNYEKAEMAIEKKRRDLQLERNKSKVGIARQEQYIQRRQELVSTLKQAMDSCMVFSPDSGIVMIAKSPLEGRKYKRDDYIYTFMPLLAVLPNLSAANSEVYIREIDISRVKLGDSVRITFDALDNVTLMGKVAWINQMAEDHKDFDMKVFKVFIWLAESDPGLKPAMSSNNEIIINRFKDVLTVPIHSVFTEGGGDYVYLKKGRGVVKQKVVTGASNKDYIVVKEGLEEGDLVVIKMPEPKTQESKDKA
jgi:multidrug efflux pump subunit AcrA (membrane-fusion protein)